MRELLATSTPPSPTASRGRKVGAGDCARCLILRSLVDAGLPASTTAAICQRMWLNRVRRSQVLYAEGNRSAFLYAIRSGKVKLLKVDVSGREHLTAVLEAGDLFGFEAVFEDAYTTGAEALTDGEVCLASGEELKELMAEVPRMATDLARYLHHQLSQARQRQSYLTALGAQAKLAGYLLHELAVNGERRGGAPFVSRDLTLKDLGGILGLTPETVCRTLGAFKARGISRPSGGGLVVEDLDALRSLAGA